MLIGHLARWRRLAAACACFALSLPAHAGDWIFDSDFDETAVGPHNARDAARFLTQATFGVKTAELQNLERIGYDAWLSQQFTLPATRHLPYLQAQQAQGLDIYQNSRQEAWFKRALEANDQLRQRVAFALSEILVVSDRSGAIEGQPMPMANYYDILVANAFGNYRELLEQVTLNPVMGQYLSMFKNRKPDPEANIRPDENYAREIMQLFSVGLVRLNTDGTPALVGGNPQPTYTQDTIRGFAHVFTGWNWMDCPLQNPADPQWWEWEYCPSGPQGNEIRGWMNPMAPWESYHASEGTKQLLVYPGAVNGGVLPAGGTARGNLELALDNVFNHPNVGPFIAYRLIQRLTTSNPSPAYVGRVAAKFNDDGTAQHVRGNLQAVVRQILMDPEARNPAQAPAHFGKLREPLLRTTHLWRALEARSDDGLYREWNPEYNGAQAALRSPTVFNFFLPDYALPGEIANAGLVSPEFQITTDTYLTRMSNNLDGDIYWAYEGNPDLDPEWHLVKVNLAPLMTLANQPQKLVDRIDLLFMNGRMSPFMVQALVAHINDIGYTSWPGAPRERVQDALWLTVTSPEYVVEK